MKPPRQLLQAPCPAHFSPHPSLLRISPHSTLAIPHNSPGEAEAPASMITDIYATQTRRRLLQPGDISGSFLDLETAAALATASSSKQPKLPTKTAKLLISPSQAASIECATVAYPSVGSSINTTLAINLMSSSAVAAPDSTSSKIANATLAAISSANSLGGSKLSFTFPYFETLYYDPVISFGNIDGMSLSVSDGSSNSSCAGVLCGRTADSRRTNGAVGAGSGLLKFSAVAGALLMLVLL